jgi:hypothetical protein
MKMNLTLITSIVLTAALATTGTYYMTTSVQPTDSNSVEATAVQQPTTETKPVTVATIQESGKPVEVIVKTQIIQKEMTHKKTNYIAEGIAARNKPQPHLKVFHQ